MIRGAEVLRRRLMRIGDLVGPAARGPSAVLLELRRDRLDAEHGQFVPLRDGAHRVDQALLDAVRIVFAGRGCSAAEVFEPGQDTGRQFGFGRHAWRGALERLRLGPNRLPVAGAHPPREWRRGVRQSRGLAGRSDREPVQQRRHDMLAVLPHRATAPAGNVGHPTMLAKNDGLLVGLFLTSLDARSDRVVRPSEAHDASLAIVAAPRLEGAGSAFTPDVLFGKAHHRMPYI